MHLNIWKELTQKRRRERQSKSCQRQVWLTVVFHPYKRFLWRLRQKVRRGEEMHLVHKCDQLIAAMELKAFKKQFSMWKTFCYWTELTVFENHRKCLIQHGELRLHFEWTKVNYKCQKWSILASFWKPEACGQTVLPDMSVRTKIGGKCQNSKIQMRHFE